MAVHEIGRQALRRGLALLSGIGAVARETPPGRRSPRIAVIGNCQASGVAHALEVLLPHARIDLMPVGTIAKARRTLKALADGLTAYDHVFAQPFPTGFFPDGDVADMTARLPQMRLFPALVFSAFHPDMIYAGRPEMGSSHVPSPLHTYHSAIILFGHLRGLSAKRIVGLFRKETFAALGYLDGWRLAAEDLSASSRAIGFDLGPDLRRWSRRGAFMHGINHPALFVIGEIAARLAREAGLAPEDLAVESYLADDLLDGVIWPVYPPIAAVYGLSGSYAFKRRGLPDAVPSVLDLDGVVSESLALYRTMPRARLACHRTENWSGAPDIRALFDAA